MGFWKSLFRSKKSRNAVISNSQPAATFGDALSEADVDALTGAFHWRQIHKVRELLKNNPALAYAKSIDGESVLHLAAKANNADIAKLALAKGIDVNTRDNRGNTPLHEAAKFVDAIVLRVLLRKNANCSIKSDNGSTPLHFAALNGCTEAAELLLTKGADVNARNDHGETPLHLTVPSALLDSITRRSPQNRIPIVRLLLAKNAEVNPKDSGGLTPLRLAANNGQSDLVEMLRQHGGHE
ncbi:MAG TPA: ankyrin repeat domain-containing protein [Terriglobia bacterium]|nr:ankyrin repeat domain-containing protein [Terriglobia bacterium]